MPRLPHRLPRLTLLTALLTALLAALTLSAARPAIAAPTMPLDYSQSIADPAIAYAGGQHLVVATGSQIVRGVSNNGRSWQILDPALLARPSWARPDGDMWAPDIIKRNGRWLLYFAAPVFGLAESSRCIGVATADRLSDPFMPVGDAPLVCPAAAMTPPAQDQMIDAGGLKAKPVSYGAIDPAVFVDHGRLFLIYKTDGVPSSIRLARLAGNGLRVVGASRRLLRSTGVEENPVMLRHGGTYYLMTAAGDYTTCGYSTVVRSARNRTGPWQKAKRVPLLTKPSTRLCGPGGADILVKGNRTTLYFHAWVCYAQGRPCREPFHAWGGQEDSRAPVRALYAVRLVFRQGRLALGDWL